MSPKAEPQSGQLEQFLLDNAMHMELGSAEGDAVGRKEFNAVWDEWGLRIIAALMCVGAFLVMHHWKFYEGFGHSVCEAFFVAGIVTLIVDPFLKRRLQKEVAQDIFHHLLGIDFPVEIRDAFQAALFGEENYRKDFEIEVIGNRRPDDAVVLEVTIRSKIVFVRDREYASPFQSEEAENAEILQASVTYESKSSYSYDYSSENGHASDLVLNEAANEPMVMEWNPPHKIPVSKGDTISTYFRFLVRRGPTGFFTFNFVAPTIHPRLRIRASNDLEIHASPAKTVNGNEYLYQRVFLPADHIQVRWKPKGMAASESEGK